MYEYTISHLKKMCFFCRLNTIAKVVGRKISETNQDSCIFMVNMSWNKYLWRGVGPLLGKPECFISFGYISLAEYYFQKILTINHKKTD